MWKDNKGQAMCNCEIETELGDIIIQGNSAWIYEKCGDFLLDFSIKFCPFCGENVQPERSKREDSMYGMKAEVDEDGILTMENGIKFNLRDAVL